MFHPDPQLGTKAREPMTLPFSGTECRRINPDFTHLVDRLSQPLLLLHQGKIWHANPAFCNLSGWQPQERELGFALLFPGPEVRDLEEVSQNAYQGRMVYPKIASRLLHSQGYELEVSINPSEIQLGGQWFLLLEVERTTPQQSLSLRTKDGRKSLVELEHLLYHSPAIFFLWRAEEGWPVEFDSDNIRQFGYTPEDYYQRHISYADCIHPDDLDRVSQEVKLYSEKGRVSFTQEYRMVTKSGQVRWTDDRTWVRRNGEGRITHYQGMIVDITERKMAEKALRDSENRFLAIFNSSPDGLILASRQSRSILEINERFEQITGLQREEVIGQSLDRLQAWVGSQDLRKFLRDMEEKGRCLGVDASLTKKGGQEVSLFLTGVQVRTSGLDCILMVARDVTHYKRLEKDLWQVQKMEAIGTLAGGIAHDFNNILFAMLLNIGMVKEAIPHQPTQTQMLEQAIRAGERAKDLISQILTFSRKSDQRFERLDLRLVLDDSLKLLRSTLPSNIQIEKELDLDRAYVLADPSQMQQVIMNLCTNAGHAMKAQGGRLQVRLDHLEMTREEAQNLQLEGLHFVRMVIADQGTGMVPEVKERIFEPFFTTKPQGEGTGMGLAVVHGIVQNHRGSIQVESQPGKGSSFSLLLPAASPVLVQKNLPQPEQQPIQTGQGRLLVVDDEAMVLEAMSQALGQLGYQVTPARRGEEALEIFLASPEAFDLVVTDQSMPGISGTQLAYKLRSQKPDLPLILVTGYDQSVDEEIAAKMGFIRFLMKPVNQRELAQAVFESLPGPG